MKCLKISIITVSRNAIDTIEQTIRSVVEQVYDNIEYIVIDGGSTDGTADVVRKYEDRLAYWTSEADHGMYDALTKGFERVTGDICAYINADDFYQPNAFRVVGEIMEKPQVKWITGIKTIYNEVGQIVNAKLPYRYRRDFIQKGIYNRENAPYIQQESTFWRTDLLKEVDFSYLASLRLAGDYYLWYCFSKQAELDIISCVLSGFRKHSGQLSENRDGYRKEMDSFIKCRPNFIDQVRLLGDRLKGGFPLRFNQDIIQYDFIEGSWKTKKS